jgi:hypothetical protein
VNRAVLERRLDAIAAEVAALQPMAPADPGNNPFAWLAWLHTGDLMWIEGVIERGNLGIELTPEERAQWLALEAGAIRRMLAGEPPVVDALEAERER